MRSMTSSSSMSETMRICVSTCAQRVATLLINSRYFGRVGCACLRLDVGEKVIECNDGASISV